MTTPLISMADLRECRDGGMAILAMPGHRITHFYEAESIGMEEAMAFFAEHDDLDYVDDVVYLARNRE